MSIFKFSQRGETNLRGIHPHLEKVVRRALQISTVDFGVADRFLEYTNSLRARAMHPDTHEPDSSGSGTTTAAITYCQVVLWIDPLLAAIDQANTQLAGIREIEKERGRQNSH